MLTIVARIEVQPDQVEWVKTELLKLLEPTRQEAGCIQYDLHQDKDNPRLFLFYENWENRELWQAHIASEHIQDYRERVNAVGAIASFSLQEMERVG